VLLPHLYSFLSATGLPEMLSVVSRGSVDSGSMSYKHTAAHSTGTVKKEEDSVEDRPRPTWPNYY
jgi:hypothetical protein